MDVETGQQIGQARSVGSVEGDSAFALIDRFTVEIVGVAPTPEDATISNVDLARLTTTSVEALKAYLEGESLYRRSDFVSAIEAYQRAVAIALHVCDGSLQALQGLWVGKRQRCH